MDKIVHEMSPKVSTKCHPFCPRDVTYYVHEMSATLLNTWIQPNTPTALLGDMNEDIFRNSYIQNFMATKGFSQLINKPTCTTGSILNHIYVNDLMSKKRPFY